MLKFASYQANANPNHRRYQPTPVRATPVGETKSNKSWEDVEKAAPSNAEGGKGRWGSPCGSGLQGPQTIKNRATLRPSSPSAMKFALTCKDLYSCRCSPHYYSEQPGHGVFLGKLPVLYVINPPRGHLLISSPGPVESLSECIFVISHLKQLIEAKSLGWVI